MYYFYLLSKLFFINYSGNAFLSLKSFIIDNTSSFCFGDKSPGIINPCFEGVDAPWEPEGACWYKITLLSASILLLIVKLLTYPPGIFKVEGSGVTSILLITVEAEIAVGTELS